MTNNPFKFGFRVVGNCRNERHLINWDAAFLAHCADDPLAENENECYLSAFMYGDDFRSHHEQQGTTKGYAGETWSHWLWFDIDFEHDIEAARQAAKDLICWLTFTFTLDLDALLIFYSGKKGFHIGIPTSLWNPQPSKNFHRYCRVFAEHAANSSEIKIDTGIYDRVRCFRAPNSKHPKSGLYKIPLTFEELTELKTEGILDLAKYPREMVNPASVSVNDLACEVWKMATQNVDQIEQSRSQLPTNLENLNRATLDFIRNGAPIGDRHRVLFSAAANLAELNCPKHLAIALLSQSALDSGLSPREVKRQIDCGLDHGWKGDTA